MDDSDEDTNIGLDALHALQHIWGGWCNVKSTFGNPSLKNMQYNVCIYMLYYIDININIMLWIYIIHNIYIYTY